MGETVGIVILNYNGLTDTIPLLESIWQNVRGVSYSLIVVDNASDNHEADYLESYYGDRITVLRASKNCGYAAGNNIGLRYAVEKGLKNICILNNDTIIYDDFFQDCIQYLDKHSEVAFVSPAILSRNQRVQSTGGTYSLTKGNAYHNNVGIEYEKIDKKVMECDLVFGACMLFKTALLDTIGYIPEAYFLMFEETEWCLKAKKQGKKCVCLTNHYIIHKGAVSIGQKGGKELYVYLFQRNRVVFAKRNLGKLQFLYFLFHNFFSLLYQSIHKTAPFKKYLRYHIDGLTGRIDPRFPYIWINEND